ncbi:hypothetical protein [Elongatibacter sediminis]|uniref:Uncharacterized protein n=1 Tax=Elongatibacter sediminis TaxID=3119006 RepID=A0AAW9RD31_9GAMM
MDNKHPVARTLAVLFLVLLLLSLGGRFRSSEMAAASVGPTHIAAGGEVVYVHAAGSLYRLDSTGALLDRIPLQALGVDSDPIDLRVLPDGRLLVATQRPAAIRVCQWVEPAGDSVCETLPIPRSARPERQFKVLADPALKPSPADFILTDARGDDVLGWNRSGAVVSLLPPGTLAGPNDLAAGPGGTLWIADTDHRRIVELVADGEGGWKTGREHGAVHAWMREARHFPMMLAAGPGGQLWVTQASEFSDGRADLVTFDPERGATGRIDLPGSLFATDVAAIDGQILVTDLDTFRVFRVDALTRHVGFFGDGDFTAAMDDLRAGRARYLRLSTWSLVAVVLCAALMIAAAVAATPKGQRLTPAPVALDVEAAPESAPEVRGVHWLPREPRFERSLVWLKWSGVSAAVLMVTVLAALWFMTRSLTDSVPGADDLLQGEFTKFVGLGVAFVSIALFASHQAGRALALRLGSDGRRLHFRLHDGRDLAAAPSDLVWTGRAILYRGFRVPLQGPGAKGARIYPEGELENWVAPLLRDVDRISEWEALKRQWRAGQAGWVWLVFAVVVLGLVLVGAEAFTSG